MLTRIKEIIAICVTLILTACLFYNIGFYNHFHFNITNYLSAEDFFLIFFKDYKPLIFVGVFLVYFILNIWFAKSLGADSILKTRFKLMMAVTLPVFFLFFYLLKNYPTVRVILFVINFLYVLFYSGAYISSTIGTKKDLIEIKMENWFAIFLIIIVNFLVMPYFYGCYIAAEKYKNENVNMVMENNEIVHSNDSSAIFIGKTKEYFFLYNKTTDIVTAYKSDDVKAIEFLPEKKK